MCEALEDKYGQWNKSTSWVRQSNPLFNDTHPFLQNCSVWSIDFRKNDTACPARMRPDCQVLDDKKYNFTCPFGAKGIKWPDRTGRTTEYCECIGLIKRRMPIGHTFYCVCERNLAKNVPPHFAFNYCDDTYLFKKKCVIHWPYEVTLGKQTVTRYYLNCSFVHCHEVSSTDLFLITGFNTTCVNSTVFVPVIPSTQATTTTTTTNTPTTNTPTTNTPTTNTPTTTKPTTITPTTITTARPTTTTTITTTVASTTPTTPTTLPPTINFTSTTYETIFTSAMNNDTNKFITAYNIASTDSNFLVELKVPVVEYSRDLNQGSLFGLMLAVGVIKLLVIIGVAKVLKKRFNNYPE